MSDALIRECERAAKADLANLPAYLRALAHANRLLAMPGPSAYALVQVQAQARRTLAGAAWPRNHPWRTAKWDERWPGVWWAPARGAGQERRGARRLGDPTRFYLLPSSDRGRVWWSDDYALPFDSVDELLEWIATEVTGWKPGPTRKTKAKVTS